MRCFPFRRDDEIEIITPYLLHIEIIGQETDIVRQIDRFGSTVFQLILQQVFQLGQDMHRLHRIFLYQHIRVIQHIEQEMRVYLILQLFQFRLHRRILQFVDTLAVFHVILENNHRRRARNNQTHLDDGRDEKESRQPKLIQFILPFDIFLPQ